MPVELAKRFGSKVSKDSHPLGCWLWFGARSGSGYGQFWIAPRKVAAHRVAWELAIGAIPDGLRVLHRCDIRVCVNPDHLFLGTQSENLQDMAAKGRHCFQQHPERAAHGELAPLAKLTWAIAKQMRRRRASGVSAQKLATEAGVNRATVFRLLAGKTWREAAAPVVAEGSMSTTIS